MGKLSKRQINKHLKCLEIIKKDELTYDEKQFIFENYQESYSNKHGVLGAFFTPSDISMNITLCVNSYKKVIDMCAGIGRLASEIERQCELHGKTPDITCIELNPEFVEVGKKLVPSAKWICADITNQDLINELKNEGFTQAISNPPFGNIKYDGNPILKYSGNEFEFKVLEIACTIADSAAFIMPQSSTPFLYSGNNSHIDYRANAIKGRSKKYDQFSEETGINMSFNCGINCHSENWKNTKIVTELIIWQGEYYDDDEKDQFYLNKISNTQMALF